MATSLDCTQQFPGSPAEVLATLRDPAYVAAKAEFTIAVV